MAEGPMERKPVAEWTWDDWEQYGRETTRIWEAYRRMCAAERNAQTDDDES